MKKETHFDVPGSFMLDTVGSVDVGTKGKGSTEDMCG